jgi:hypothetical protein
MPGYLVTSVPTPTNTIDDDYAKCDQCKHTAGAYYSSVVCKGCDGTNKFEPIPSAKEAN